MASEPKPAPAQVMAAQVMIVEAEVSIRTIVADRLREFGLRVIEAASSEEAAAYLRDGAPVDLVFGAVQMPCRTAGG